MNFPKEIFRAYDIRGLLAQLTPELAAAVGQAVVKLTGAKCVAVGYDMRQNSPELAAAVIEGVTAAGAKAVDIGQCTTPMFNFAVANFPEHEAGIMITASHNPAEYNGFKMTRGDGMPISGEEIRKEVEKREVEEVERVGNKETFEVRQAYLAKLFSLIQVPSLAGKKIAVDAGNGMGGVILPQLFQGLDCEMIPMYFEPDGNFPHHEANPVKFETLRDLQIKMRERGADLGIALDGDADRVIFVDEQGEAVPGDAMLALLAAWRLQAKPGGTVVWSPNASWAVRDAVIQNRGRSVWEKVGRTKIIKRMKAEGADLGGETSGHYFWPEFANLESTDFVILFVLAQWAKQGGRFSELTAPARQYFATGDLNFTVTDQAAVLARLRAKYEPAVEQFTDLDGYRFEFADWWFCVRASNTEPLLRFNLEATSADLRAAKRAEIEALILEFAVAK